MSARCCCLCEMKEGLNVLWRPIKVDGFLKLLFFCGWGTRRQAFTYMETKEHIKDMGKYVACYIWYPFSSTYMAPGNKSREKKQQIF